ncbi:MAG TPA: hypothetical protein VGI85_00085 [Chthoniobacterales bacterium]
MAHEKHQRDDGRDRACVNICRLTTKFSPGIWILLRQPLSSAEMPTRLADYYLELQRREGLEPTELVAPWEEAVCDAISEAFRAAMAAAAITAQDIPLRAGSSNQSIGNQVADYFVPTINRNLQRFYIDACSGGGYPDKILREIAAGRIFPFELKATSIWDISDSNRRVLTSSSRKLRLRFRGAANHILATLHYVTQAGRSRVRSLRLDFIDPDTLVNIRLEASVSHRSLGAATHRTVTIE